MGATVTPNQLGVVSFFGDRCLLCLKNRSIRILSSKCLLILQIFDNVEPDVSLETSLGVLDKFKIVACIVKNTLKNYIRGKCPLYEKKEFFDLEFGFYFMYEKELNNFIYNFSLMCKKIV